MTNNPKHKILFTDILYRNLFGFILSKDQGLDAETLTNLALYSLGFLSERKDMPGISLLLKRIKSELHVKDIRLEQRLFDCNFYNPIGLAAGFDKNGVAAGIWDQFGFGFAELGTVTWHPQLGNPKPRLYRLAKEKAALNRMGFNNKGAKKLLNQLNRQGIQKRGLHPISIGINFGKSKIIELEKAAEDYALSLELLGPLADYAVINISSPNTPNLRDLQDPNNLKILINRLSKISDCPPLLLKIAPDLNNNAIKLIGDIAVDKKLAGIIATNTSINRLGLENRILTSTGRCLKEEKGGLSGEPLHQRSLEVMRVLSKQTKGQVKLIGVGGIHSPESAWERIAAGASLIQIYTSWIFEGPYLIPKILKGLIRQLDRHGFKHISEAVGSEAPWQ